LCHFETKRPAKIDSMAGMKTNQFLCPPVKPGEQLWGITFNDAEYAREMGDPLRAVVAAPTKIAAEEAATTQLGLEAAWAYPLSDEQIKSLRKYATQPRKHPRISLQPTADEIHTAIEVLRMLDQRLTAQTGESIMQLPGTELGDRYAAHIEARHLEQTGHIEKVSMQLQNWREELVQQQKQQVTQSV
jgi:hypothetical protein